MARAREAGLDWWKWPAVEAARLPDHGLRKWKYAQSEEEQKSSPPQGNGTQGNRIKTPKIGTMNLEIKIKHARDFLSRGEPRAVHGCGSADAELATWRREEDLRPCKEVLSDISKVDQDYRYEGKRITMTLAPGTQRRPFGQAGAAAAKPARRRPTVGAAARGRSAPAPAGAPVTAAPAAAQAHQQPRARRKRHQRHARRSASERRQHDQAG